MKKRILMALLAAMTAVSIAACSSEETAGDNVQESSEGNASESAAEDTGEDTEASAQENAAEVAQENASGESDILVAYFTYADNADLPEDVDASAGASIQVRDSDITGNTGVAAQCGLSWPHRPEISAGIPLFSSAIRTGGATCPWQCTVFWMNTICQGRRLFHLLHLEEADSPEL